MRKKDTEEKKAFSNNCMTTENAERASVTRTFVVKCNEV